MPCAACGSHRKRRVPGFASLTLQVCVPTNGTVVLRSKPGATRCASWIRARSRTATVYVPVFNFLTAAPADVFSVIVNPGLEVSTSFDAGVTTPGVGFGAGSGAGTLPTLNDPLSEIGCTSQM